MTIKTPQEMSNEELLKNEKTLKASVTVTIISCLIMLGTGIFLLISKSGKINVFLFLPLVFAATGFTSYNSLKGIKKEILSRNI